MGSRRLAPHAGRRALRLLERARPSPPGGWVGCLLILCYVHMPLIHPPPFYGTHPSLCAPICVSPGV